MPDDSAPAHGIPYREALGVWLRVAAYSFGGPAGQIAVMHRILVEEKRWISEARFLHALNYCMLLPGPEAQQLATYIGWLLHRARGGLTAGILFVLPGFISILALSILYAGFRDLTLVEGIFFGIKPAVLAIVLQAVLRIGRRALTNRLMLGIAAAAFAAIYFLEVPFPLIIIGAALVGLVGGLFVSEAFEPRNGHGPSTKAKNIEPIVPDSALVAVKPTWGRSLTVLTVCLTLWLTPIAALWLTLGRSHVFVEEALFFSKAAVVTFGGAYAVLAYIAQAAVETHGWLAPGEMLDGLGMAETTPGPLIQVVQFVGFMGAYRDPGALSPMTAGTLAALLTTWVTFVPCFLWIFLGAPFVEVLRGVKALNRALTAITAAVVGVILNLAIWFALHTLFETIHTHRPWGVRLLVPEWATLDAAALAITAGAMLAIFRFRVGMITTLLGCAMIGAAVTFWHAD